MKIAVTGHRPDSLYGYDMKDLRWIDLGKKFEKILVEQNCTEAITGMALGVDQEFANSVIHLRESGMNIKLTCVIPCRYQEKMWPESSKLAYYMILNEADNIRWSSIMEYDRKCMQRRNRYIWWMKLIN